MSDNIHYVYCYLDPRNPGSYNYGEYTFEFEPFYIGHGHNRRMNAHIVEAKRKHYKHSKKLHTIQKLLSLQLNPIIILYKEKLFENDARILEIKMISSIGRFDLGKGPLSNLTDGGEGSTGVIVSEETRLKQRLKRLGKSPGNKGLPCPISISLNMKGKTPWNKGLRGERKAKTKIVLSNRGENHFYFGKTGEDHPKSIPIVQCDFNGTEI